MKFPEKSARFDDQLTRGQRIFGFVWLPVHIIVLPLLLGTVLMILLAKIPDEGTLNVTYYLTSFVAVLIGFWSFLKKGYHRFIERFRYCLLMMVLAYLLNLGLSLVVNFLAGFLGELSLPNNDAIDALADANLKQTIAVAIFMAPIVEEVLFRGVLFGSIARKSRVAAYAASVILFSLYHVWQFAVLEGDPAVLINAVEYIPLSAALTFCYDRTESIWPPIFFHILINTIALAYLVAT